MAQVHYVFILQNLARVSSGGGGALGRTSSFGTKALLASKQIPQEPSAKFPLPAPKSQQSGKVSWRAKSDPADVLPGTKPAESKVLESQKSVSSMLGNRGSAGMPRISK